MKYCIAPPWLACVAIMVLMLPLARPAEAAVAFPQRIVSLAPSITETLFALGAGGRVVGVSRFCDYPPQARQLPKVGSYVTINLEAVVALRPDLIIGLQSSANERQMRALLAMGYPVLFVRDDSVGAIQDSIGRIGHRLGLDARAAQLIGSMNAHFARLASCLRGAARPRALLLVGHQPIVAAGGGYLGELLEIARDDNIAAGLGQTWPRLSVEYVVASAPEIIFDGQMGTDPASPAGFWGRFPSIPAVRDHRVYGYNENPMLRPGPRIWQSLDTLALLSHPKRITNGPTGPAGCVLSDKIDPLLQ